MAASSGRLWRWTAASSAAWAYRAVSPGFQLRRHCLFLLGAGRITLRILAGAAFGLAGLAFGAFSLFGGACRLSSSALLAELAGGNHDVLQAGDRFAGACFAPVDVEHVVGTGLSIAPALDNAERKGGQAQWLTSDADEGALVVLGHDRGGVGLQLGPQGLLFQPGAHEGVLGFDFGLDGCRGRGGLGGLDCGEFLAPAGDGRIDEAGHGVGSWSGWLRSLSRPTASSMPSGVT